MDKHDESTSAAMRKLCIRLRFEVPAMMRNLPGHLPVITVE